MMFASERFHCSQSLCHGTSLYLVIGSFTAEYLIALAVEKAIRCADMCDEDPMLPLQILFFSESMTRGSSTHKYRPR